MANLGVYGFLSPGDSRLSIPCQFLQEHECETGETQAIITQLFGAVSRQRTDNPAYPLVGAAASQLGINKPIIVMDLTQKQRIDHMGPLQAFINPQIIGYSKEVTFEEEFCPSVDSRIRGAVARSTEVIFTALTPEGNQVQLTLNGLVARNLQHLCDHTQGLLIPDRNLQNGFLSYWVEPEQESAYEANPEAWEVFYNSTQNVALNTGASHGSCSNI